MRLAVSTVAALVRHARHWSVTRGTGPPAAELLKIEAFTFTQVRRARRYYGEGWAERCGSEAEPGACFCMRPVVFPYSRPVVPGGAKSRLRTGWW